MNRGAYSGLGRISDPVNGAYNPPFLELEKSTLRTFVEKTPSSHALVRSGISSYYAPGEYWETRQPGFANTAVTAIAFGSGLWMAGGTSGTGNVAPLRSSTDTITWTTATELFGIRPIAAIIRANNLWVAGGQAGQVRISTDGVTWVTQAFGSSSNINSFAYGNGLFVAAIVGSVGSPSIRTSTDTVTWSNVTSPQTSMNSVVFANNQFVIGGNAGQIRTSTDGLSWVTQTSTFGTTTIRSVAYGDGLWVAVGDDGQIRTSTNAITWVTRDALFGTTNINSVAYGDGLWVAVGQSNQIRTSTNGITWVTRTSPLSITNLTTVAFGDNRWLIGATFGQMLASRGVSSFQKINAESVTSIDNVNLWERP